MVLWLSMWRTMRSKYELIFSCTLNYVHPQKFKPVSHWRSYHRMDFSSSRWPLSAGASLAMNRSDPTACSEVVLFFDLQCQPHRENGGTRSPWDGGSLTINPNIPLIYWRYPIWSTICGALFCTDFLCKSIISESYVDDDLWWLNSHETVGL